MNEITMVKCRECRYCKHPRRLKDDSIVEIKDKWLCDFGGQGMEVKPDSSCCFGKEKANG